MKRWLALLAVSAIASACSDVTSPSPDATPERLAPASLSASLSSNAPIRTGRYIVLGQGWMLPADLEEQIAAAGGTVVDMMPQIGVAVAEAVTPGFEERAARIRGIESVTEDMILQWVEPVEVGGVMEAGASPAGPAAAYVTPSDDLADNAWFYSFQWAPGAIQAPEAWEAGYTGQGVRVAIIDGGLYEGHLDLAPNIDMAASASFVPGFAWNQDTGTFWHATHVAGIVAATGQNSVVGIAPNATIIGVKALHSGSGAFEWILNAILYSAAPQSLGGADADIINMSLGATINYRDNWHAPGFREAFRELEKAYDRANRWAYGQGTLVIASAGNSGYNYDVFKQLYKIPAQSHGVVAVASTAPHGWALGATDFDRFAFYSDHGKSLLDVAAPGGTPGLIVLDENASDCTVAGTFATITFPCFVFDYVVSSIRGQDNSGTWVGWAYGTSMAAPAATGVAALIIEKNGGTMAPQGVRAALAATALDLGKPGQDEYYGLGWVNAYTAVMR